ncbi:hypothetical protein I6L25_15225 [Acinetobacter nosocomialis]|uniref:hypothetical protein n=1 Tax=Acinetobacter calcoaceticus/baumannii complex TaxID=909768 RepID=UPI0002CF8593|nr:MULTISPECIES: hypothetical protein [Acinetobacter calcoaceticus/baumannii complex]ENU45653.1 hypothetical protein F984_02792 [Acinetobacter nosocomialis NIPH 2119]MDE1705026.1 hypothetical protein [Acinetobacter nosocomialis]PSE43167.1 hypothetical protein C7G97_14075 [Acinetobacter nosocomialis]PSE82114.1 hypothetical protein C7G91_14610 [Acinetobacter nosocomialis]QXC11724.1 hypothetical protein I6L25_15225 [Acinetobacter nosocomialis]
MNYTWDEFEQRLITYRDVRIDLARVLDAYELQIKELLQKIQLLAYEESLPIFNQLYEIQDHLATAKFRYDLDLNEALDIFVYQFDRDDKAFISQYWYKKFKQNKDILWPLPQNE